MKALTLKHPWPWAICRLGKNIENRHWKPTPNQLKPGDWFAIHGGKAPKRGSADEDDVMDEVLELLEFFDTAGKFQPHEQMAHDAVVMTGIVAVCKFGGFAMAGEACYNPWFEGPVGWVLSETIVLPRSVPCKGAQGLWDIPGDVGTRMIEEWHAATKAT